MKSITSRKTTWALSWILCAVLLTSCAGLVPAPIETATPTLTPTASPTIVWFPATNTPTLLSTPTPAPTVEARPGVGELIFADSFDQADLWNTASSAAASAAVLNHRLELSVTGPGPLPILSLRSQPVVDDFYAEAEAFVGLCLGLDQFGMAFRAAGGDYYRFTVNCQGQVRFERSNTGSVWPLKDWQASGDAPLGAPATLKLGVWAVGSELRFYINDHFQFGAQDRGLGSGTLGFFAFASGSTPVAVSFSELNVYSVSYVAPTPTLPTPTP